MSGFPLMLVRWDRLGSGVVASHKEVTKSLWLNIANFISCSKSAAGLRDSPAQEFSIW